MMKIMLFTMFSTSLCFMKTGYWMVQVCMFILSFYMLMMNFYTTYFVNISYFMGMDLMSYGLVILSLWICSLMWTASEKVYKHKSFINLFNMNIVLLLLLLMLSFSSMNLLMFYIFFESSLIPTLFLILGWGYQPERLQAGVYLLFYTLFVSLPMFISVMYMYMSMNTLNFSLLYNLNLPFELLYFSMILAFLVKMPMFLVHLWLPKAHVEAPVSGSMILAGVMLKLGGYGLLRIFPMMMPHCLNYNYIWISISLVGGVLVSLICLRQTDLKSLVAYSSVVHMGIALSGMMTLMTWGLCGSYCIMIGHGLCSSGLFCLVNISYERMESRSLLLNKGMMTFMPSMTLWWFLLSSSNMAAPPSLNLLGEISLINSIMSWSSLSMLSMMLISFFSAAYMLYFYSYSQHGIPISSNKFMIPGTMREYILLFLHWVPLNLLIMKSDMCFMWL